MTIAAGQYGPDPGRTEIVEALMSEEGFKGNPYLDTRSNPTIGYGTLLPLTELEARVLLIHRLENNVIGPLAAGVAREYGINWGQLPHPVRVRLVCAAYQLGVHGLLEFQRMFRAIREGDWETAAANVVNSRWYVETRERALLLHKALRAQARRPAGAPPPGPPSPPKAVNEELDL